MNLLLPGGFPLLLWPQIAVPSGALLVLRRRSPVLSLAEVVHKPSKRLPRWAGIRHCEALVVRVSCPPPRGSLSNSPAIAWRVLRGSAPFL